MCERGIVYTDYGKKSCSVTLSSLKLPLLRHQSFITTYTGWPKKVSQYQVSSLNRIKNRH